jgi:hypothetical protein
MDRNDMRLGVSARALEPKQTPEGEAKNRVGEVSHGDFHNREGPGILKPVVLVEGQVPPVHIKIPLGESFKVLHESPHSCAVLCDIPCDILFESLSITRLKSPWISCIIQNGQIFSLDRPERIQ